MNPSKLLTVSISIGLILALCDTINGAPQYVSIYGPWGGLKGAYTAALKQISSIVPSWFKHSISPIVGTF